MAPERSPLPSLPLLRSSLFHRRLPLPQRMQVSHLPYKRRYYHLLPPALIQRDAHVCLACSCAGSALVSVCPAQPVDAAGKPRCALCPIRLTNCKGKLYKHEKGKICQRCYNQQRHSAALAIPSGAPAAQKQLRKRRAESDPGELSAATAASSSSALTRRVTPPSPVPASKKPRVTRQEERIMRLLDETHARRMAAETAEAVAAASAAGDGAAHPRAASK
jgi:hypothetical protein